MNRLWVLLVCSLVGLAGCGQSSRDTPPASPARNVNERIVCLVPAMTRMLVDLGLRDRVVGVNRHDMLTGEGVPIVSSYPDVDVEKLLAANPTLVIVAATKDSPSQRLLDLGKRKGFTVAAFPYPESVEAVAKTLYHEGTEYPSLGHSLGLADAARQARDQMLAELDALRGRTASLPSRSVLICFGLSPIMASGPGTVNDDLLTYVNATNAASEAVVKAPTFDREQLLAMQPDVILLVMPGAAPLTENDPRLSGVRDLDIPAVRDGRVHLIRADHALQPSTNLPALARLFAELIHGAGDE